MREIILSLAPARLYEQSEVVPSGGNIEIEHLYHKVNWTCFYYEIGESKRGKAAYFI